MTFSLAIVLFASLTIRGATENLQRGVAVKVAGDSICAEHPLPRFYAQRDYAPAWVVDGRLTPVAFALIDAIEHAADHGLRPDDYHIAAIRRARDDELDLLLTDAFFLLASHLASGRVDPVSLEPTWCLTARPIDLVGALEEALDTGDVSDTLQRIAPAHPQYRLLLDELARLRAIEEGGGWGQVERGRIDQLMARLTISGDLQGNHTTLDADVERALRRFQRLHGLAADGVAGARTLAELNVPAEDRIRQIELNLERWRWLPATLGDRYALVNIPAFHLTVIDQGRVVLEMRIVVGQVMKRTPVFSTAITQVVFNPSWFVPDSIASDELWPAQSRDPSYFEREHIEVLGNGSLRQKPGPWNALGRIKFNMPNRYSVYMHDTPSRTLFGQSVRTFSHGCIRLEKPGELMQVLLPGEDLARHDDGVERAVDVASPLPVHILYWTVFADEIGELHFVPDVYGRDAALDEAMRKRPDRF
ncbi:MAG TPA: L,D-transpeptidase family protein [Thermoanaerobaculia bacterium]|nr:L,D-transpeptidase family protein [Thermoanaerobaculia bacterium]